MSGAQPNDSWIRHYNYRRPVVLMGLEGVGRMRPSRYRGPEPSQKIVSLVPSKTGRCLRCCGRWNWSLAAIGELCGFDDDLTAQITAISNRVRGLLSPPRDHPPVADLLPVIRLPLR